MLRPLHVPLFQQRRARRVDWGNLAGGSRDRAEGMHRQSVALAHPHAGVCSRLSNVDAFAVIARAIFGAFVQLNLTTFSSVPIVTGADTTRAALSSTTARIRTCRHFARVSHPTLLARARAAGAARTVSLPGAHSRESCCRVYFAPIVLRDGAAL
jgi:hypothetical protein